MNIEQHRQQAEMTRQLHERLAYLNSLDDGQLLGLFRSLIQDMTLAQYRMEVDKAQSAYQDLQEVERLVYQRMAERNTVRNDYGISN